ncbi:EamA family transporter RarD [Sutterella sp.]|uniref:EamA family transporter RarD n=1 Tax=Sutterella sp. TaxID=1981025 RepID=UPI0026E01560|nr:EamA family transporter RarD [Sutterella sp.]MDO5532967.1 EamA family transporter RarD [Sutterella sp.]
MPTVSGGASPRLAVGVTAAFIAYLFWGFMPLYWKMLSEAWSWEVIAHRVCWSFIVITLLLIVTGRAHEFRQTAGQLRRRPPLALMLVAAAMFAGLNWWINVLAVQIDRVVELGIGMFLTPLISMALGFLIFRERLSRLHVLSIAIAAAGVVVMTAGYGRIPVIALGVSSTWAIYGAFKKKITINPWVSNALESLIMMPLALVYLWNLHAAGEGHFLATGFSGLSCALVGTGIITSIPMIAFAYSALNLPMYLLGFCQFLNPVLTILVGVFILGSPFNPAFAVPLVFIAVSVAVFLWAELKGVHVTRKVLEHAGKTGGRKGEP